MPKGGQFDQGQQKTPGMSYWHIYCLNDIHEEYFYAQKESLMRGSDRFEPGRREFMAKLVPACSFLCFGASQYPPWTLSERPASNSQDVHKFDKEFTFGRKMTFKQYYSRRFNNKFIPILLRS